MSDRQFCSPIIPLLGDLLCYFLNKEANKKPQEIEGCQPGAEYIVDPHNLSKADMCAFSLSNNNDQKKQYTTVNFEKCEEGSFLWACQKYRRVIEGINK